LLHNYKAENHRVSILKNLYFSGGKIRALNGHFKDLPQMWYDLPVVKGGHYLHGTTTTNATIIKREVRVYGE
jgi:hypothetical protein